MLEDTERKVINQKHLIGRIYRMSKREVRIDNINSLTLSTIIVEKRVKQEAWLLQDVRKCVECIIYNTNLLYSHIHYRCRYKFALRILLQGIC
jgi:hypothetical protein